MGVRVRDQLLGGHIYDVVVAREDVVQLRLDALGDDGGRVLAVYLVHTAVDQVLELAVGVLYLRREEPVGEKLYLLAHVRDGVRVPDHSLVGRLPAEVGELLKHLVRRPEIEGVGPVSVGEFLGREQYAPVNLVPRIEEVDVAGGDDGLIELARELYHAAVQLAKALVVAHRAVFDEEAVVRQRHYLKVVVEIRQLPELLAARAAQHGAEDLARLAGRANEQALAVLREQALGDYRVALIVLQIACGDELVEVLEAGLVADEQGDMPHAAPASAGEAAHDAVHVAEPFRALVVQHGDELLHHARDDLRVVKGAVVVEFGEPQVL